MGKNKLDGLGQELIDLIIKNNLDILNNSHNIPTYSSTLGNSWIDVVLQNNVIGLCQFDVLDHITLSDHNLLTFKLLKNRSYSREKEVIREYHD